MPDEPKEHNPFKPEEPSIPGVTGNPARVKPAPQPPRIVLPQSPKPPAPSIFSAISPNVWMAIGGIVIVLAALGMYSRKHAASASETQTAVIADPADLPSVQPAQPVVSLPLGPGPIATTAELSKTWSSKKFLFRSPQTADDVPALVVRLPGSIFWAISMREPFGTCQLQYVTNLQQLSADYQLTADHPMIADPCSHTVYDLTRYGAGPNGVVRGAVAKGESIRPPIAIEVKVRGKDVVATRMEP
ncbi:MAG: hypothetical protein WA211_02105 [Candidatus Acidiferrales bacterium]